MALLILILLSHAIDELHPADDVGKPVESLDTTKRLLGSYGEFETRFVRCLIVANVDSIGLVVRRCTQ